MACAGGAAQAQAFDAVRLFAVPAGDGEGLAGLAVIAGHEYLGSDERKTMVLPALSYQWKNGWFAGTGNGVGYKFDSPPTMQYGLARDVDLGRDESDAAGAWPAWVTSTCGPRWAASSTTSSRPSGS